MSNSGVKLACPTESGKGDLEPTKGSPRRARTDQYLPVDVGELEKCILAGVWLVFGSLLALFSLFFLNVLKVSLNFLKLPINVPYMS